MKHLFFCTILLALFLLAGCADSATTTQASAPDMPMQITPAITPSPTPRPTPTPTPEQKPVPTQALVQQSVQQQPTPPPATGVNGNPWGYDFNPGNYITDPPSAFCSYFSCIKNFPNGRGYVEECQDGMYSKAGGISGSCSYHGGNWRPLYSH